MKKLINLKKKVVVKPKKVKEVKVEDNGVFVTSQEVVNNGNGGHVVFHLSDGTDSLINPNK